MRRTVSILGSAEKEHSLIDVLLPNDSAASNNRYITGNASLTGNNIFNTDFCSFSGFCLLLKTFLQHSTRILMAEIVQFPLKVPRRFARNYLN